MSAYATVGAVDSAKSNAFYDAVLGAIGWSSHAHFPGWRGYSVGGSGKGFVFWVAKPFDGKPATAGNGTMTGFFAASQQQVHDFHAAALAHGGTDEGEPGPRPHYGPTWYAAYMRDPAGNKIAIVCNE